MLEQVLLAEQFCCLLDKERAALKAYELVVAGTQDASMREQLEQVVRDKRRHVRLAERLLEIVQ